MKKGLEPVHPVEFIRSELARLDSILYDFKLILNRFYSLYGLPRMEYRNMSDHGTMGSLLELLMNKGNSVCQQFVSMLQEDAEVKETFPRLSELDFSRMDSRSPPPGPSTQTRTRIPLGERPSTQTQGSPKTEAPGWGRETKGQTLQGHIQTVSKLMKKNKSFFRTVIRTEKEECTVLVFDTKMADFTEAKKTKSLVALENLRNPQEDGSLVFNSWSRFRVLTPPDPQTPAPSVTVDHQLPRKGATPTASTAKEVQSTPSPPCDSQKVTIVGVRLEEKFRCPQGHLLANPLPDQGWDCRPCSMKYSKVDSKRVLSGKVLVRETDVVLELTDSHIKTLLKASMDSRSCGTIGELETALKEVCFLEVTLNQGSVISVSRTSPDGS